MYNFHYLYPEGLWAIFKETTDGGQMFIKIVLTPEEAREYCDKMNKAVNYV